MAGSASVLKPCHPAVSWEENSFTAQGVAGVRNVVTGSPENLVFSVSSWLGLDVFAAATPTIIRATTARLQNFIPNAPQKVRDTDEHPPVQFNQPFYDFRIY